MADTSKPADSYGELVKAGDRVAAALDRVREIARQRDELVARMATGVSVNVMEFNAAQDRAAAWTPRFLAVADRLLARHKPGDGTAEIHTLEKGWHQVTACAGCEEPWPCEDYRDIAAGLLGEEADRG